MAKCRQCDVLLTKENCFNYTSKYNYVCSNCESKRSRERYKKDKDKEKIRLQQRRKCWDNKLKVIKEYGNKCNCCGENCPEFLTIDHINNDGIEDRKLLNRGSGEKLYRWLIKNNFPKDDYQLLCYNCNCAKGFFGYCPHNPNNINFTDSRRKKLFNGSLPGGWIQRMQCV